MRQAVTFADEPSTWTMEQARKVFKKLPAVIDALGMSPSSLAKSLGCDRRSVYRWFGGGGLSFYHATKLAAVLQARSRFLNQEKEDLWEDNVEEDEPEEIAGTITYEQLKQRESEAIEKLKQYERGIRYSRR